MRSLALITVICLSTVSSGAIDKPLLSESDHLIDLINSKQSRWRAGRNFDPNTPRSEIKKLLGLNRNVAEGRAAVRRVHQVAAADIPESFDARENWFDCGSIKRISDQSACGSCWAVATADAMSDRVCVASGTTNQPKISSANIMECCSYCGDGCDGGFPYSAWKFWIESGVVTGGAFNSTDGCQNYPFPSCEHHQAGSTRPACPSDVYETPSCSSQCDNGELSYEDNLTYGSDAYMIEQDVQQIQMEIIKNGPVVADFDVYEDFLYYKSGVYQHVEGDEDGGHSVRIIGWGVEDDVEYWLVANSWNDDWGDQGLFKIIRGVNECGIEEEISAGLPKL